jgi:hypothetical protein
MVGTADITMVGIIIIMGTNIRAWTRVNVAATIAGIQP